MNAKEVSFFPCFMYIMSFACSMRFRPKKIELSSTDRVTLQQKTFAKHHRGDSLLSGEAAGKVSGTVKSDLFRND